MVTEVAKKVVRGFMNEACSILKFDKDYIRILYVSQIPSVLGVPQFSDITDDGCLILCESWLNQQIIDETQSRVRCEVYCKVWIIYKQSKCVGVFNKHSQENIEEAMAFCCAMFTIKGLFLPLPHNQDYVKMILEKTKDCLNKTFGMNSNYYQVPEAVLDFGEAWKFRLTNDDEHKFFNRYYSKLPESTIRVIDSSERGTEQNPFEDVNEAFEYIKQLEENAYDNDSFLKDIASQQFFYDINRHQFCVPWASPYVAFYNDANIPSNGFVVNQNRANPDGFSHFTLKPNLYKKKFLYRGQNKDYPGPCVPNLFRNPNKDYYLDDLIWAQELEILVKSHPLVKLLSVGIKLLNDNFSILMNSRGLSQHYYHKSSLLDLTSNIDVAKFFATTEYIASTDSYVPVHKTDELGVIFCYELQLPNAFEPHIDFHLSTIGKQVFSRSGSQYGYLLDLPKGSDLKKLPQVKKFYFKHKPFISDTIFRESNNGQQYFAKDILEDAWYSSYKNRKDNKIVSSDAVKWNLKLNSNETYDSICEKLKQSNIFVDEHHPRFSPDLLDKYYLSIKNGWWEEFCSDIYFHGGDAALYKDCLMRIPQREEYKWAFEKQ